jgi:hypothetical protein
LDSAPPPPPFDSRGSKQSYYVEFGAFVTMPSNARHYQRTLRFRQPIHND